jgi:hypothetical protein
MEGAAYQLKCAVCGLIEGVPQQLLAMLSERRLDIQQRLQRSVVGFQFRS